VKNVIIAALVAAIVVLLSSSAFGQNVDRNPFSPEGAAFKVEQRLQRLKAQSAVESIDQSAARLKVAEAKASAAQAQANAAKAAAARASSGVQRLGGELKGVRKDTDKLSDTVYGPKGKDGNRAGGLVSENAKLQDWRKKLDASLAGPDGEFGTADDVVTGISEGLQETNRDVYGYEDESGKSHPGVLEVVWGKDGKGGLRQGFAVLKEQIAGAASQGAVWWVGIIAVLSLLLSALNFLRGRGQSTTAGIPASGGAASPVATPPAPTLANVNPGGSPVSGGTPIMITGSDFDGSVVYFGKAGQSDLNASAIVVDPAGDQITCQTPVFTEVGSWTIFVRNSDGQEISALFVVVP